MANRPRILLFDIDLTLIRATEVNVRAMARAFEAVSGIPNAMDGISFAGRTDRWIVGEAARRTEVSQSDLFSQFAETYPVILDEEFAVTPPTALRGAAALLESLYMQDDVTLGLATGNMRAGAELKLKHAGLAGYFDFDRGGYGDHDEVRIAVLEAAVRACAGPVACEVVVIGDSEHDITAARAIHALAVGVATGHRTVDELAEAGADFVLPDLSDRAAALAALLG